MRIFLNLLLIYVLLAGFPCLANELGDFFEGFTGTYPENAYKSIDVYKGDSPMRDSIRRSDILEQIEDVESTITSALEASPVPVNKFAMGNGIIYLPGQIRKGVRLAIEDSFGGYAEYERRKIAEEIINASYNSYRMMTDFLLNQHTYAYSDILSSLFAYFSGTGGDSADFNLFGLLANILKIEIFTELISLGQNLALALILLFSFFSIFSRLGQNPPNIAYVAVEPVLKGIAAYIAVCFTGRIADLLIHIFGTLSSMFSELSGEYLLNYYEGLENLDRSWAFIANQVGYAPAVVLSLISLLAQFAFLFYLCAFILLAVIGRIALPLWIALMSLDSLKISGISSCLAWIKALSVLSLLPLAMSTVLTIIGQFPSGSDFVHFVNIALSISMLLCLPILTSISKIVRTQ
jgi:hypothetical protein